MSDSRTEQDIYLAEVWGCNSHGVASYRAQCERAAVKRTLDAVEAARSEYELKAAIARMRQGDAHGAASERIDELEERYEMLAQDHAGALADRRVLSARVAELEARLGIVDHWQP